MGGKLPKKKKPGVGVDFKKVKHKVGKKLPRAQNETNTNFTARAINLPNQSVNDDKSGAAVNQRNLTLKVRRQGSAPPRAGAPRGADPRSASPLPARRRSC
jgi:pre-rRNA-processing protein IPI1